MNFIRIASGVVLASTIAFSPAFAQHEGEGHGHEEHQREQANVQNEHRQEEAVRDQHIRDQQQAQQNSHNHDRHHHGGGDNWKQERSMYRNNWNHVSEAQRQQYEEQMHAQWMAYHHNHWSGNAGWNNYSDPKFLDYVHNSNPSLLTSVRNMLGF